MSDTTKQIIADCFEKLAATKPVHKIQIKELCCKCGIERTTFYYHFCDKYELVSWIFEQMFYIEAKEAEVLNNEEMILKMFKRIQNKKDFFVNALQDDSQNNLRDYILKFYIDEQEKVMKAYRREKTLDEETRYALKAYSYGCMGLTVEWLLNRIDLPVEKFAQLQYSLMPEELKRAYSENNS